MFHHVARSSNGLLFRSWFEAWRLWLIFTQAFPELVALCVMPDHIHLILPHDDPGRRLGVACAAYARWRNAHRSERGPIWRRTGPPKRIADDKHLQRTIRYVHLNPCRSNLVDCPAGWALSTHRDRVGLAVVAVVPPDADPQRFHAYVSADRNTRVDGTPLPWPTYGRSDWWAVRDAVSSVCREPVERLDIRGLARTLAARAAWHLDVCTADELAAHLRLSRSQLYAIVRGTPRRGETIDDVALFACIRAVGDKRFQPLSGPVRLPGWRPWREPGTEST